MLKKAARFALGVPRRLVGVVDRHTYVLSLLIGVGIGALVYVIASGHTTTAVATASATTTTTTNTAVEFYGKNLRGSLFSAFLTLGSFLLSLKTFIVVKMKEGLYDQAAYKERHTQSVVAGGDREMYAPVFALRGFLFWSILASLTTAVVQMTVGLLEYDWAVAIAVAFAAATLTLLVRCLIEINRNLKNWLNHAAQGRRDELDVQVPENKSATKA